MTRARPPSPVPAALYEQTRRLVFPVLSKERDWHAAIHDLVRLCRFALGADISARVPTDMPRYLSRSPPVRGDCTVAPVSHLGMMYVVAGAPD
jgi:hypothetical protein